MFIVVGIHRLWQGVINCLTNVIIRYLSIKKHLLFVFLQVLLYIDLILLTVLNILK